MSGELHTAPDELAESQTHGARQVNILFRRLERSRITGPSTVMRGEIDAGH